MLHASTRCVMVLVAWLVARLVTMLVTRFVGRLVTGGINEHDQHIRCHVAPTHNADSSASVGARSSPTHNAGSSASVGAGSSMPVVCADLYSPKSERAWLLRAIGAEAAAVDRYRLQQRQEEKDAEYRVPAPVSARSLWEQQQQQRYPLRNCLHRQQHHT